MVPQMEFRTMIQGFLFVALIAAFSGCCNCNDRKQQPNGLEKGSMAPPVPDVEVRCILMNHSAKTNGNGATFRRDEFSESELIVLDRFVRKETGHAFRVVTVSACGECLTSQDHEKGVYYKIPGFPSFCVSCGVGK